MNYERRTFHRALLRCWFLACLAYCLGAFSSEVTIRNQTDNFLNYLGVFPWGNIMIDPGFAGCPDCDPPIPYEPPKFEFGPDFSRSSPAGYSQDPADTVADALLPGEYVVETIDDSDVASIQGAVMLSGNAYSSTGVPVTITFANSTNSDWSIVSIGPQQSGGNLLSYGIVPTDAATNMLSSMTNVANWFSNALATVLSDPTANRWSSNAWVYAGLSAGGVVTGLIAGVYGSLNTISNDYGSPSPAGHYIDSTLWAFWQPVNTLNLDPLVDGSQLEDPSLFGGFGKNFRLSNWAGAMTGLRFVFRRVLAWAVIVFALWFLSRLVYRGIMDCLNVPAIPAGGGIEAFGFKVPLGWLARVLGVAILSTLFIMIPAFIYTFLGTSTSPLAYASLAEFDPVSTISNTGGGVGYIIHQLNMWLPIAEWVVWIMNTMIATFISPYIIEVAALLCKGVGGTFGD